MSIVLYGNGGIVKNKCFIKVKDVEDAKDDAEH